MLCELIYVFDEWSLCDVSKLWREFTENQNIDSLTLKIRAAVSDDEAHLFEAWCRYFGFKIRALEIETNSPIDRILDPKSFDNLTSFTSIHVNNPAITKSFLTYLSRFSPSLQQLRIRCDAAALPAISGFSKLQDLSISLQVPWWMAHQQLEDWTQSHVISVLPVAFNKIASHLKTFAIFARRIPIPWSQMDLFNLTDLEVDTGLFHQILFLTNCHWLQRLTYSYYGEQFVVSEMDDWEVLMEHLLRICEVKFKISYHFSDRIDVIDWIATFAEDWPNTLFKIDDYWGDEISAGDDSDECTGRVTVFKSKSKPKSGSAGSILVQRMKNLIVKIPAEQIEYFTKYKVLPNW